MGRYLEALPRISNMCSWWLVVGRRQRCAWTCQCSFGHLFDKVLILIGIQIYPIHRTTLLLLLVLTAVCLPRVRRDQIRIIIVKRLSIITNNNNNTEFLNHAVVQGQCVPGPTGAVFGGEPPSGVLTAAPNTTAVVVTTSVPAMNQLGTVYATKRRRRNGKR